MMTSHLLSPLHLTTAAPVEGVLWLQVPDPDLSTLAACPSSEDGSRPLVCGDVQITRL